MLMAQTAFFKAILIDFVTRRKKFEGNTENTRSSYDTVVAGAKKLRAF